MFNDTGAVAQKSKVGILERLWRSAVDHLIQDVPDEIAACEFGCRKKQCTAEEWAFCETRLQAMRQSHQVVDREIHSHSASAR